MLLFFCFFNDFSKINETMDSVKEMVSTHDTKINSLDERVTKLEDAIFDYVKFLKSKKYL